MAEVGFEKTVYRIAENVGAVEVCVNVERPMINCPISLPFTLDIRTTPGITTSCYLNRYKSFFYMHIHFIIQVEDLGAYVSWSDSILIMR